MLKTEHQVHIGLLYTTIIRDKIVKTEKQKSLLKLQNVKRKVNFFDSSKVDIEVN